MYAGASAIPLVDEIVYFGINAHWEPLDVELPGLPPDMYGDCMSIPEETPNMLFAKTIMLCCMTVT